MVFPTSKDLQSAPEWFFIVKVAGSAEVPTNANQQYIITNKIRSYLLITINHKLITHDGNS